MEHGGVKEHEENVEGRRMISLNWQHLSCFRLWLSRLSCHCWSDWKRISWGGSLGFYHLQKCFFCCTVRQSAAQTSQNYSIYANKTCSKTFESFPSVSEKEMEIWHDATTFTSEKRETTVAAVACNDHYSRKESHEGVKPCYSFTLFPICWNESKQRKPPLWFLIFSIWVFICDCLNWNVWCQKAARSQSLFTHKEHFRLSITAGVK